MLPRLNHASSFLSLCSCCSLLHSLHIPVLSTLYDHFLHGAFLWIPMICQMHLSLGHWTISLYSCRMHMFVGLPWKQATCLSLHMSRCCPKTGLPFSLGLFHRALQMMGHLFTGDREEESHMPCFLPWVITTQTPFLSFQRKMSLQLFLETTWELNIKRWYPWGASRV